MENRLLILKDKKLEILAHFKVRPSRKALELFDDKLNSGEIIQIIRWAHIVTDKALGLKYVKEYFERLIAEENEKIAKGA